MAGINDIASDGLVRHNISLMRFDAKLRRQVRGQLRRLQQDITEQLGSYSFADSARKAQLERLLKQTDEIIKGSYRTTNRFMAGEMGDLAIVEHNFATQQLNNLFAVDVASANLSPAALRALSKDVNIFGAPAVEHWGRQSATLRRRFADEMRQGFLLGESTQDLIRRVRGTATGGKEIIELANGATRSVNAFEGGIMQVTTREAEALVRTSVNAVANEIRLTTYEANTDVIGAVQAQVTLDSRTSDICIAHGAIPDTWSLPDYEPLNGSNNFVGPPPWHFNCRSSLTPITKSWEQLQKQGNANGATRKQQAIARKLDNNAPKATRASMDGQVPKDTNYNKWLKKQPAAVQNEVLGPTRRKLWQKGKLNLSQTLDQTGRPLSLKQMGLKDAAITGTPTKVPTSRRAGLAEPDAFIPAPRVARLERLEGLQKGHEFAFGDDVFKVHKVTPTTVEVLPWSTRTGKFVTARNRKVLQKGSKPGGTTTTPAKPPAKPPVRPPAKPTTTPPPKPTTTTGMPKAPLVDSANYRSLKLDDVFKDAEGNVWKVYGKSVRGVKVVPWSTKSNRFLAKRNGRTLGYTSEPAKTVKQFKQSTANTTEAVGKLFQQNSELGLGLPIAGRLQRNMNVAIDAMGKNGFNKVLAEKMASSKNSAQVYNMAGKKLGNKTNPFGNEYSTSASGTYWSGVRTIGMLDSKQTKWVVDTWVHEFGHHMDYTVFRNQHKLLRTTNFTRQGKVVTSKELSKASEERLADLNDAYKAMVKEYRTASKSVAKRFGLKIRGVISEGQQRKNYWALQRHLGKDTHSSYSLHNQAEWFAEMYAAYFNRGGSRTVMARNQPATHNLFQALFSKDMEPLWKELFDDI